MRIKNARPFPTAIAFGRSADDALFLAVIVKATLELRGSGLKPREALKQLPIFTNDEPYNPKEPGGTLRFESDLVPFKPRSDVILVGHAYAPFGRPTRTVDVEIKVGALGKKLRVFGDRAWSFPSEQHDAIPYVAGPADFVQMPLTWDRAFGGVDKTAPIVGSRKPWSERNYLGQGFCGARTVASINNTRLPNIEDPDDPIRTWDSNPRPAGCGFFPRNSRPRVEWFGTFDDQWKAQRAPKMPVDFSFAAYNGADLQLQASPYLLGNEAVRLTNVLPGGGNADFSLPGLVPRLTVAQGSAVRTAPANLDTLVFVPDDALMYMVWRATLAIETEDASDVSEICIEYDHIDSEMAAAPRRSMP